MSTFYYIHRFGHIFMRTSSLNPRFYDFCNNILLASKLSSKLSTQHKSLIDRSFTSDIWMKLQTKYTFPYLKPNEHQ